MKKFNFILLQKEITPQPQHLLLRRHQVHLLQRHINPNTI